ncbi:MAG: AraC family transcriptional regulator [Ktedonobacterales bacterium]
MKQTQMLKRRVNGPPVYTYTAIPGMLPLSTLRLGREFVAGGPATAHSHDFFVLGYFERGGGSLWIADQEWWVEPGDVYIVAPGEVVGSREASRPPQGTGWAIFFPPEILGPHAPGPFLSWRTHPLLLPFVRGTAGGVHHLQVPPGDRYAWSDRIRALDSELSRHQAGYRDAALAHLTLLLVEVSRLAAAVVDDLRLKDEHVVAAVFGVIEERYGEPISLKDVARAVSLSPGHLTTVIRRKTGRTVLEWITERRMVEARRLLAATDLSVEEVGRRVGYGEAGYFVRSFRRALGVTPASWRRAGRPQANRKPHNKKPRAAGRRSRGFLLCDLAD